MATIRTSIALYDGVTSPLANMNRALNIVLNSFEAMQGASGRAIDTAAIQQARKSLPALRPRSIVSSSGWDRRIISKIDSISPCVPAEMPQACYCPRSRASD